MPVKLRVVLVLLVLLCVALFRVWVGRYTLNRDEPFVGGESLPAAQPPSRKLLLVVLDGARADVVPTVPQLARLSNDGAWAGLVANLPTISAAQYVSLLSGVIPQDSGRRSNEGLRPVGVDSVPAAVRRGGGRTAVFSDCVDWWPQLFPGDFDDVVPSNRLEDALSLIRQQRDTFVLVHLCAFDTAGHQHGASSDEYRVAAAASVERDLSALLAAWSDAGPVVVTADHGHTDAGGHGGDEDRVRTTFALAQGSGVVAGSRSRGRAVDLAPTLTALMGLPAPATSEGVTLVDLLDVTAAQRNTLSELDSTRSARVTAHAETTRLEQESTANLERLLRLLILTGVLALLVQRERGAAARSGLLAGALTVALTAAVYFVRYDAVSLSSHREFGSLVVETALNGLASSCVCALPWSLLTARRFGRDARLVFALWAAAGSGPIVGWMFVVFGLFAHRVSIYSASSLALPALAYAAWAGTLLGLLVASVATPRPVAQP